MDLPNEEVVAKGEIPEPRPRRSLDLLDRVRSGLVGLGALEGRLVASVPIGMSATVIYGIEGTHMRGITAKRVSVRSLSMVHAFSCLKTSPRQCVDLARSLLDRHGCFIAVTMDSNFVNASDIYNENMKRR